MIRYDLSELDPAVRRKIVQRIESLGMRHTHINFVLSVPEEFETVVDGIVAGEEASGDFQRGHEAQLRSVHSGLRPASCENCGSTPAAQLVLRRQVGMIVLAKTETFDSFLCRSCGESLRSWIQKQNAIKGWTGVRSALMNPVVIGTNERNYAQFIRNLDART
jgi:hypothetical protein